MEIKEILDYLQDKDNYIEELGVAYKRIHINNGDLKLLLDYITNLQHTEDLYNQLLKEYDELEQSYQELKDSKQWWNNRFNVVQRDYEDYKSRIEKAVEYLKENNFHYMNEYALERFRNDLLNILNGDKSE